MSKISFPSRKQKKKGHLTHQQKQAPGGSLSPLGASHQTVAKSSCYRPTVSNVPPSGDQQWRLVGASVAPGAGSVSPGAFC